MVTCVLFCRAAFSALANYDRDCDLSYMMRKRYMTSAYYRRIWTSRRGIAIATMLTLAAFALTLATLMKGTPVRDNLQPVAVQKPVSQ